MVRVRALTQNPALFSQCSTINRFDELSVGWVAHFVWGGLHVIIIAYTDREVRASHIESGLVHRLLVEWLDGLWNELRDGRGELVAI